MPQVSIIVLTYNPDNKKLRKTLEAALAQKEVSIEIIISDDGSSRKDFAFLPEFFAAHQFSSYQIVENPVNKGTVHNCFSGVQAATGEYVFLTSPGDLLFDDHAIADFHWFAKANHADLCFGNAVFYNTLSGTAQLAAASSAPADPMRYTSDEPIARQKAAFFGGDWIIGASYFRSRTFALASFQKLLNVSVYMEDTTSTMLALCESTKLHYFDRNIVWYEHGTGVSTGASEKWKKLLNKDLRTSVEMLCRAYPRESWADLVRINVSLKSKPRRLACKLLHHPVLTVRSILAKRARQNKPVRCTPADLERLNTFLFGKPTV